MTKNLELNAFWCKGCGICAKFCPRQVLKMVGDKVEIARPESCVKCGICEKLCPDFAIYITDEEAGL